MFYKQKNVPHFNSNISSRRAQIVNSYYFVFLTDDIKGRIYELSNRKNKGECSDMDKKNCQL